MPHNDPTRQLPHAIRNGTLSPIIDHDTSVLEYMERSEFGKSNIIDPAVAAKLEQHLRFRQDSLFDVTRPGEIDLVLMSLPARYFKADVIQKASTQDAAGADTTEDDSRTLKDERDWTVNPTERTVANLRRLPTMKKSRPKIHKSGFGLVDHNYDENKVSSPHIKPYYGTLHAAQYELANGDSANVSSMLTGEEADAQFSYMNELQEVINKIRVHRSMLLPELDHDAASGVGTGNDPAESHEAVGTAA